VSFDEYVKYSHFKMEDFKTVADLQRLEDFMCKLDLKDAYFTIPLHSRSQKFTRVQFKGKTYQFTCLPFGLTSAPHTCAKVLKPTAGILGKIGTPIIVYLDDMLIINSLKVHSRESRISDEHGKIHLHPCAGHQVPGNPRGLQKHEVSPLRRGSCCNSEGTSPSGNQSSCFIEPTFAYNMEVDFLQNCSSSRTPLL